MKRLPILLASLLMAIGAFAATPITWHVEKTGDDTAAEADPTGETPFLHIQTAINNASDGDTILVGDGEYGAEEGVTADENGRCRIRVDRTLTLKSLHGAAKTAIVGAFDDTANHLGPNAVRCISAKASSSSGTTVIDGFTFKNGASGAESDKAGRSGGVYGYGNSVYVIGCVITNCCSYSYACYNVNLIGCRIEDCVAYKEAIALQSNAANNTTAFTLFARNRGGNGPSNLQIARGADINMVNCTFVGSDSASDVYVTESLACNLHNCLFSASAANSVSVKPGCGSYLTIADCLTDDQGGQPLFAPFFGDYRVRPGGPGDKTANAAHLDKVTLPSGYTLAEIRDPYGNPIDTTNLHLGAIQELSETPACGALQVSADTRIGDVVTPVGSYFFSSDYPVQYVVEAQLENDETLFGFKTSAVGSWRFPRPGINSVLLMPSPNVDEVVTNTIALATKFLWVDKVEGNDETGDGTESAPYASIQKAVDSVGTAYTIVYVKKGAYDNNELGYLVDGSGTEQTKYGKGRVRIWSKKVRVIAVDGPDETSIVGASDDANGGRCLMMSGNLGSCVQGFTLTGGQSAKTKVSSGYGGSFCCIGADTHITDCVISNNSGVRSSAGYGAFLSRCIIRDNTILSLDDFTTPNVVNGGCILFACLLHDNQAGPLGGGMLGAGTYINCTVVGNSRTDPFVYMLSSESIRVVNTVLCGGSWEVIKGDLSVQECLFWNVDKIDPRITRYTVADPYFVSPLEDDYRVLACSPACRCAAVPTAANFGADYYKYVSIGFDDAAVRYMDKKPMTGAFMERLPGAAIVAEKGGLSIEGGTLGVNVTEGEKVVSISGSGDAERPCAGVVVNSVTNFFDDLPNGTLAVTATTAKEGLEISALYTSDWYVNADATVGDDTHSGFTPKNAKRTLEKAMEGPVAGDTVHAAAGTYASGDMASGDYKARVVVPAGVRLVGAGRDRTAIVGAPASEPVQGGCGPDALRCVFLGGANASVEGFTLRDGYTALVGDSTTWKNYPCNCGGAVAATSATAATATVRDCVLTNCTAARGGGSAYCRLVNSVVRNNHALDAAVASYFCSAYGCLFGSNSGTDYVVMNSPVLENCTVYGCDQKFAVSVNSTDYRFVNCIFACATQANKDTTSKASHCIFANDCGRVLSSQNADATCVFTNLAAIALDASGRPVVGSGNPAIDAADETLYDAELCGDLDVSGFQRVMNAKMDIGALEADWRGVYTQAIGNRHVTVTAASRNVTLNEEGKVKLTDEDSLAVAWNHKIAGKRTVTATIVGEGTLTVSNGTETVATFTGPVTDGAVVYAGEAGLENLSFAFSGTGTSTFSLAEDRQGLMLIFR